MACAIGIPVIYAAWSDFILIRIRHLTSVKFALIRKIRVYGNRNHSLFPHRVRNFSSSKKGHPRNACQA